MKLRPYQDNAADFLFEHDRALILAPVGAGQDRAHAHGHV
jgi:superfamily II DNA or RNA helicase